MDDLSHLFEANRPRLHAVAYRMLGSHAEADDAVQDAWLRLARTDAGTIDNLGGWLTTVVSRLCVDRMRTRAVEHAAMPELAGREPADGDGEGDPASVAAVADSVGAALQVVLETLSPAERVAFVLHDVFAVPFDDVATVIDRTPEATRQLASRARRRVRSTPSGVTFDLVQQRRAVEAFLRAARQGDIEGLLKVLHPDVELRPDAAALAMGSLRPSRGARVVAETIGGGGARGARLAVLDGVTGMVWAPGDVVRGAVRMTVVDGRIVAMDVTSDPDAVAAMEIVLLEA